jgi:hypothetical protein
MQWANDLLTVLLRVTIMQKEKEDLYPAFGFYECTYVQPANPPIYMNQEMPVT